MLLLCLVPPACVGALLCATLFESASRMEARNALHITWLSWAMPSFCKQGTEWSERPQPLQKSSQLS